MLKMASNNTGIIVIGVVLVLVLVIAGPISNWATFFGDLGGQGQCSIGVHVEYTDGTVDDYQLEGQTLFPLSVYLGDDPRPVLAIDFQVWGVFTWKGELTTLTQDTVIEFHLGGEYRVASNEQGPVLYPPTTSGASFKLWEMTIQDDQIESWAGGDGTYAGTCYADAEIWASFSDGTTDHLGAQVQADFSFTVDADMGATSLLSVNLNTKAWHDVDPSK